MTKNWEKITAEKNEFCFDQKLQLKKKHELLKNLLLLWVIFALLDPDPDPLNRLNPIQSNPDPDAVPQP
jgi:hypothetical protein